MWKMIRSVYLTQTFYLSMLAIVVLYVVGYKVHVAYAFAGPALIILCILLVLDVSLLWISNKGLPGVRDTPDRMSNGDNNEIVISVKNRYTFPVRLTIIDEIPVQFQKRDFRITCQLQPGEEKRFSYLLRPLQRGEYLFGALNIYVRGMIGFAERRYRYDQNKMVQVYPSFMQMRKYELMVISHRLTEAGLKTVRRMGHAMEFDQIRKYVIGDDYRTVNWKATARKTELMVNQYQDEKAQQVLSLIDTGRTMKMPFNGMTLLDYAINTSLVISKITLNKYDKAGMFAFSSKIQCYVQADNKNNQMHAMQEALYNIATDFAESDFELVYTYVRKKLNQRSLLIIYTNFETRSSASRQLDFLIKLSKHHLVLVVIFENTEVQSLTRIDAESAEDLYIQTIAEKFIFEKKLIVKELKKYGIHSIHTQPRDLTVKLINKYLELKAFSYI